MKKKRSESSVEVVIFQSQDFSSGKFHTGSPAIRASKPPKGDFDALCALSDSFTILF